MSEKQQYPNNSLKVKGGVEIKPSIFKTIIRGLIPNIENLTPTIVLDSIIMPYLRDAVFNSISSLMYKDGTAPRANNSGVVVNSGTNYNRISTAAAQQNANQTKTRKQNRNDYKDIILRPGKGETAAQVRARGEDYIMDLRNQVDIYGRVSIMYLFSLLDITRDDDQENSWGWDARNIGLANVVSTGEPGCYRLYLPTAVEIAV